MRLLTPSILALISIVIFSCDNDSSEKYSVDDLSDQAKNYLKMKLGGQSADAMLNNAASGNPVNDSFQRLFRNASIANGRIANDSSEIPPSDSTVYPWTWVTCAQISEIHNPDGSTTSVYDYGDGCEEGNETYKYWMFGKYSYTYRYTASQNGSVFHDSYYYNTQTDNYGGKYYYESDTSAWSSDGTSECSGESQYDTAKHTYSGNYVSHYNSVYRWNNEIYNYKGSSQYSYTEKKSIIEESHYEYGSGDDFYKSDVIEPLVVLYDCYNDWYTINSARDLCYIPVYVSGREFIRYKQGDEEGSFEIDYGNGECDGVVTIIENGKRVAVDLGHQPVYYW